jgi:hypothetical protein
VVAGLAAIVITFGIAVARYDKAADAATALAPVTGVIAALVGAYFGIRGATLAQEKANEAAQALVSGDRSAGRRSAGRRRDRRAGWSRRPADERVVRARTVG